MRALNGRSSPKCHLRRIVTVDHANPAVKRETNRVRSAFGDHFRDLFKRFAGYGLVDLADQNAFQFRMIVAAHLAESLWIGHHHQLFQVARDGLCVEPFAHRRAMGQLGAIVELLEWDRDKKTGLS